jgi:hypothetical protein
MSKAAKLSVEFTITPVEGNVNRVTVSASTDVPVYNRVTKANALTKVTSDAAECTHAEIPGYCCVALINVLEESSRRTARKSDV